MYCFYVINPKYFSRSVRNIPFDKCVQRRHKSTCASIRAVLSEASLSAWRNFASLAIQNELTEDSDQTARMRWLIWIFAGRTSEGFDAVAKIERIYGFLPWLYIVSRVARFWVMFYNASFYVIYRKYLEPTVYTLSIGTPYLLTILVLKLEIVHSTTSWCVENLPVCMANSIDPDLWHLIWVYTVCKGLSVPILMVIMVNSLTYSNS